MTDIDNQIGTALDTDDHAFLASLERDRGMFQQIGDSWKGPLGGWAKVSFGLAIMFGIGLAYSFYRALTAGGGDAMIGWAFAAIALLIMQGFLKEWMFARMNMLTILSEVKRLQVQVAMLSEAKDN